MHCCCFLCISNSLQCLEFKEYSYPATKVPVSVSLVHPRNSLDSVVIEDRTQDSNLLT